MMNWGRVADLTQRTIVWSMVGLTAYASVILARGSYAFIQRHRKIKSLSLSPADEVYNISLWSTAVVSLLNCSCVLGTSTGNEFGCSRCCNTRP